MAIETEIKEKTTLQISPPSLYKVLFLNDDVTPMDHVIALLIQIFGHDIKTATEVTLEIHNSGSGVAGVYNFEIAEQKALEATEISRSNSFPLRIRVEREE
jgi:ATP-dependent Clp protease adaptor protein ClpS